MAFTLDKSLYYSELPIPDSWREIRLNDAHLICHTEDREDYFEISPGGKPESRLINEYRNNLLSKTYMYNARGNLVWMKLYHLGRKKRVSKWVYDYSHGVKRLKEKRYYTSSHVYIKKESFSSDGALAAMTFYLEGSAYYKEVFNEEGELLESIYYQENGLRVP